MNVLRELPRRLDGLDRGGAGGGLSAQGNARHLAYSRVDAATTPRVGLKSFPQTLPLKTTRWC
jgi:hypothetical protein